MAVLPVQWMGFDLNRGEFRNAIKFGSVAASTRLILIGSLVCRVAKVAANKIAYTWFVKACMWFVRNAVGKES